MNSDALPFSPTRSSSRLERIIGIVVGDCVCEMEEEEVGEEMDFIQ